MTKSSRFTTGDQVIDRDADDPEPMYVLDAERGRAECVHVDELDATVAAVNEAYPPADPVVSCVHQSWLIHTVGDRWREWPQQEFDERLESFAIEWSLSVPSYDYPESRLRVPRDGASERPSHQSETQPAAPDEQTDLDDWFGR